MGGHAQESVLGGIRLAQLFDQEPLFSQQEADLQVGTDARQGLLQADRLRQVIDPAGRESLDHFISFRPENGCEQPPVDAIVVNHKDPPAFRLGDGSQFCRICHCVRWAALQLALSRTTARRGLGLTPSCRHSYHRMQIC